MNNMLAPCERSEVVRKFIKGNNDDNTSRLEIYFVVFYFNIHSLENTIRNMVNLLEAGKREKKKNPFKFIHIVLVNWKVDATRSEGEAMWKKP